MAVKGVAHIDTISTSGTGEFQADLRVAATDGSTQFTMSVANIPANIIQATLDSALKAAVKTKMINDYGFTFGLFDTVMLLGSTIL